MLAPMSSATLTIPLPRRIQWRPGPRLAKLVRYASVSVISTTVASVTLGVLVYTRTATPGWANLVGTLIGTVPSFELNRRWVWAKRGRRSVFREMAPFLALSLAGLVLSTLDVSLAAGWARRAGLGSGGVTAVSELASLGTFGTLWVLQFFLLDRVLFRRARPATT